MKKSCTQLCARRIIELIITVFFLMILQNTQAQQVICPCGVIVQQGENCPCHDVYKDADADGYGNLAVTQSIKNGDPTPLGYVNNSTDCNDNDNTIYPGAPELCDGKDNNCNGIIEEMYFRDFDGDGYGDPNSSLINCGGQPAGYVSNKNDCNDNDPSKRQAVSWVKDADNDGKYIGAPVISCTSPGAGYVVLTNQTAGDFNDTDPFNSTILYVNANAGGGIHDGTSWGTAYITLQDALTYAQSYIAQIWVAAGTYYPDEGGGKTNNDISASFNMKNGIAIYGGFNGTETYITQRNWKLNPTILSGDIDKDGTNANNSLTVVYNYNVNNTALLDGFTITKGNFYFFQFNYGGGGMRNENSSPVIVNCIFSGNRAGTGGGLYNINSFPLIRDCSFIGNSASADDNSSADGGAVFNYSGTPTFINCTFSKNSSALNADVVFTNATVTMTNCILWGNGASSNYDYFNNGGTLNFTYSDLQDYIGVSHNITVDPLFVNVATNDFRLQQNSPAISAGLDSVNREILDLSAVPRKAGVIDMGAYEYPNPCNPYTWVKDADGDNYYAGSQVVQCTSPGAGYKIITTQQPGDCNDNDPAINPNTIWHRDADSDGYHDPNYIASPSCTPPQDGKHYSITTKGHDCNDNNAAQNPETIWVKDADGDGYYTGNVILGCLGQTGYKIRTNEVPGDCNDNAASAHIGATEIYNGIDDNCDGKIDEGLCGPATNLTATNITQNSATINWADGLNSQQFTINYKPASSNTWTVIKNVAVLSYNLTGLSLYTHYNFRIQTLCLYKEKSPYSTTLSFTTSYGGPSYCATRGVTDYEYIYKVVLGSIKNTSGDNLGYGDYTNLSTNLAAGGSAKITLTPGFYADAYTEYWEVYIDYNQDGLFNASDGEKVATHSTSTVSKSFTVPLTAKSGYTRMRVMMHYAASLNQPCGSYVDGETEDYTVNITGGAIASVVASAATEASNISSILVIPNPVNSYSATAVLSVIKEGNASVRITDVSGRTLYKKDVSNLHTGKNPVALTGLATLTNGIYVIEAEQNGVIIGRGKVVVEK